MSSDNGFNPMRWDCSKQGCFNVRKRPKLERFADCLPGKLAFTDVDGLVEYNGNFLFLEWKSHSSIGLGQRILFEQLTRLCPACVLIVEGDAEHMTVESVRVVRIGSVEEALPTDFRGLHEMIECWASWAAKHPRTSALPT